MCRWRQHPTSKGLGREQGLKGMELCYAIKDWDKHFENSESRKVKSLTWVPVKNKHDGKGYRRVVSHPKSVQVFCAWNLIVQVASKTPRRGLLRDEDGPLTTSDLAAKTGYPEAIFELAFEVLIHPKIGWLVKMNPDGIPEPPETSGDAGAEQKGTEGNRTEGDGNPPPQEPNSCLTGGAGDCREIPDEDQAVQMVQMGAGVPDDFARFVYRTWATQGGKNGNGILVDWLPYVTNRWKNECVEWRAGTHNGKRGKINGRVNSRNVGMSETAADKAAQIRAHLDRKAGNATP